jgi:hypothetical protein
MELSGVIAASIFNNAFILERASPPGIDLPEEEDHADFSF